MTPNRHAGFTLVELLTCLLIGSIFLSLALPSFSTLLQKNQTTQQVNQLMGLLHYARGTAVLEKKTVGVCAGTTTCSTSSTWQGAVLIFHDRNANGQLDSGEQLLRQGTINHEHSWTWSSFGKRAYLLYERNGTTRALNGTFTLCRKSEALHQVVISLEGRIRAQSPTAGARCS